MDPRASGTAYVDFEKMPLRAGVRGDQVRAKAMRKKDFAPERSRS
jgi:hypothetical protein